MEIKLLDVVVWILIDHIHKYKLMKVSWVYIEINKGGLISSGELKFNGNSIISNEINVYCSIF